FDHQPISRGKHGSEKGDESKTDHQMLLELSPKCTIWILFSNTASFMGLLLNCPLTTVFTVQLFPSNVEIQSSLEESPVCTMTNLPPNETSAGIVWLN